MKQFILALNKASLSSGHGFVLQDLDETHLFIDANWVDEVRSQIDEWTEKHVYAPVEEGKLGEKKGGR